MTGYFKAIWVLFTSLTKRFFRDPTALFFTFLFPLLFLFVFGSLYRNNDTSFSVAVINNSEHSFATEFKSSLEQNEIFSVKNGEINNLDTAREKMGQGELNSIIELPASFGEPNAGGVPQGNIKVYYEESEAQAGQTVASIVQQMLDGANQQLTGQTPPLNVELASTDTANLSQLDYLIAGLMGFTILSLGIFGMANGFPADKKTGSLRRLRASPLRASQLILATALEYLVIGLISLAMLLAVAIFLFDFHMRGDYLTLTAFSIIGIFCLFGFGLAIGGWAKNENQSAPLSNLIAFPMMFLSGVFFPIYLMPEWLQSISNLLPLTPVIDGIRAIVTENASLLSLGHEFLIIAVWIVIIYAVAFKVFRWE